MFEVWMMTTNFLICLWACLSLINGIAAHFVIKEERKAGDFFVIEAESTPKASLVSVLRTAGLDRQASFVESD
jgi:hypothetical protein